MKNKFFVWGVILLMILFGIGFLGYKYSKNHFSTDKIEKENITMAPIFSNLVSSGANIPFEIPQNILKNLDEKSLSIEPEITGSWSSSDEGFILKPEKILEVGSSYILTAHSQSGNYTKEVFITSPPKIISVFPSGEEISASSTLTIVFSRPMVALTALDTLDMQTLPVSFSPPVEGEWTWKGTKILQFTPQNNFLHSTKYTLSILDGMKSVEGLDIESKEYEFTTKKIRPLDEANTPVFNKPFLLKFNQPVNREETKNFITLESQKFRVINDPEHDKQSYESTLEIKKKISEGEVKKSEFIAEPGEDPNSIKIFLKQDANGREKIWDINTDYTLSISKAISLEGDIIWENDELREQEPNSEKIPKKYFFATPDVLKNISIQSERSTYSSQNFFDPESQILLSFYEDIDITKNEILAPNIKSMEYKLECIPEEDGEYIPEEQCEKQENKKEIILSLDAEKFTTNEKFTLNLKKIFNTDGLLLKTTGIEENFQVIPEFKLLSVHTPLASKSNSTTTMTLCSTTPIQVPEKEDREKYLSPSNKIKDIYWQSSYKSQGAEYDICKSGEFETTLSYKLLPFTKYDFNIAVVDVFAKKNSAKHSMTTGELPSNSLSFYPLQNKYSTVSSDGAQLSYYVENMDFMDMEICKISDWDMMEIIRVQDFWSKQEPTIENCIPINTKKISIENTLWNSAKFSVDIAKEIPNLLPGHYVFTFSNPKYLYSDTSLSQKGIDIDPNIQSSSGEVIRQNSREKKYERSYVTVTDLSVVEKRIEMNNLSSSENSEKDFNNLYWVNSIKTLEPKSGVEIEIFKELEKDDEKKHLESEQRGETNKEGLLELPSRSDISVVMVRDGEDKIFLTSTGDETLQWASTSYENQYWYLYTDRPIYKPSDEVNIKGIYRIARDGSHSFKENEEFTFEIIDSRNNSIATKKIKLNKYGTFETKISLGESAPLGEYYGKINCKDDSYCSYERIFEVQDYTPSAFEVDMNIEKSEYFFGDTANLSTTANYYFGVPLDSGTVEYTVMTQDYYFNKYEDENFSFGSPWYRCWYQCSYGDKFLFRKTVKIENNGTAHFSIPLEIEKYFPKKEDQKSKIFIVTANIKSDQGSSVSIQKSFIAHKGKYYLGLKTPYFSQKGDKIPVLIKSVTSAGDTVSLNNIVFQVEKVDYEKAQRKETDGNYYFQYKEVLKSVLKKNIETDENGDVSVFIDLSEEGEYKTSIFLSDPQDSDAKSMLVENYIYLAGDGFYGYSGQDDEDTSLDVIIEKNDVEVGEKAKLLIKSPFKNAKALISIERGNIKKYEIVDISQSLYTYSFDVLDDYIPNIYVSVTLLGENGKIKSGVASYSIPITEKNLDITLTPLKKNYQPGEKVTIDIEVKNSKSEGVSTEISLSVVDKSVLALLGNPKKNPVTSFFSRLPLTVSTLSTLKNFLQKISVEESTKGGGGGGGDALESSRKKRGDFYDTAFWTGQVETDENGKAQISFTLPDNLTTWQAEVIGVTKDTKLGSGYSEFSVQKPIMVEAIFPKIARKEDVFSLRGKIFNQTDETQVLEIVFESSDFELLEPQKNNLSLTLLSKESQVVSFPVKIIHHPDSQAIKLGKFSLSANNTKNQGETDSVEHTIQFKESNIPEGVATSGYSTEKISKEYFFLPQYIISNKGDLKIQTSSTLAVFLPEALKYLVSYPYGCSEQIASKLMAFAIIEGSIKAGYMDEKVFDHISFDGEYYTKNEAITFGVKRLGENQNSSGGFGYFSSQYTDFHLTIHIVSILQNLKKSGFDIPQSMIENAYSFLQKELENSFSQNSERKSDYNSIEKVILVAKVLNEGEKFSEKSSVFLQEKISSWEEKPDFIRDELSTLLQLELAKILVSNPNIFSSQYKNSVLSLLEEQVKIDTRGAYLATKKEKISWSYYENSVKNTALAIEIFVLDKRDSDILRNMVAWIIQQKNNDGSWGSTNTTLSAIQGLNTYLSWKNELDSDFDLTISLSGEEKTLENFSPENPFKKSFLEIPVENLKKEEIIPVEFLKTDKTNQKPGFYYDIALKYFIPTQRISARDEGFFITRKFFLRDGNTQVSSAKVGDVLRGEIEIVVPELKRMVSVEDFIPAGVELINFSYATESKDEEEINKQILEVDPDSHEFFPDHNELRSDRIFLFSERVNPGTYTYTYFVRALTPGKFEHPPAIISEMYTPENFGRTQGEIFEVVE